MALILFFNTVNQWWTIELHTEKDLYVAFKMITFWCSLLLSYKQNISLITGYIKITWWQNNHAPRGSGPQLLELKLIDFLQNFKIVRREIIKQILYMVFLKAGSLTNNQSSTNCQCHWIYTFQVPEILWNERFNCNCHDFRKQIT